MAIRVAHWGVGSTGRTGLQGVIGHPQLELVALCVQRPENVGRDAGDLCDRPPTGVTATSSADEILALKPDCLSYFGSGAADAEVGVANVARFLDAGVNVVTTSFTNLVHPKHGVEALCARLEAACRKGGTSFFATGVEPGYMSDIVPRALLSGVDRIDEIRVMEIGNWGRYPVEWAQREVFGFGKPMDHTPIMFQGERLIFSWGGVVRGMADMLGVELDEVRQWHEFGATSRDVDTAFGLVEAGTIGALRFAVEGMYGGKPICAIEHVNYVTDEMPEHWPRAKHKTHTVYRTVITGRPTTECEVAFGYVDGEEHAVIATAIRAVNGIPAVVAAAPGLLSPHEVPANSSGHVRAR
jgi:4-hydroxy-tetrahydrodipicolinate reductase